MKSKYVIIDDVDKPCARLICELVGDRYYYMRRDDKVLRRHGSMTGRFAIPLEDFGFTWTEYATGHTCFVRVAQSKAKYPDGKIRNWQDCHEIGDTFELKRVNLTQREKKVKP